MLATIKHDLYLMVAPPAPVIGEIGRFRSTPGLVQTPVADERLHMTVAALGRFEATPHALIAYVDRCLSGSTLPSFRVMLNLLIGGRASALLQPSEALPGFEALQTLLATLLRDAIAFLGIDTACWRQQIKPHVTLGYRGHPAPTRSIDPISWTADRLLLVESLHGASKHVVHATWPLSAAHQLGFEFADAR